MKTLRLVIAPTILALVGLAGCTYGTVDSSPGYDPYGGTSYGGGYAPSGYYYISPAPPPGYYYGNADDYYGDDRDHGRYRNW